MIFTADAARRTRRTRDFVGSGPRALRRLASQFVGFGDREELVIAMQPRKIVAFPAIQESFLPKVNVKKSQERAERKALGKDSQPAPGRRGRILRQDGF